MVIDKIVLQYYSINEHKIGKGAFGVVFKAHSIKGKAQKSKNFKLFGQSANFPVIFSVNTE